MPFNPQVVHTEKSLSSVTLLGVPALHDAVEALGEFGLAVALEPFRLDQAAAQRGGRLLKLAGEVVFADRPPDTLEGFERLAVRVQRLALTAPEAAWSPDRLDLVRLIGFGDRRKAQHFPGLLREDVADEVILVQALHDNDNRATALVVEPAVERVVVPVVAGVPLRRGERVFRL